MSLSLKQWVSRAWVLIGCALCSLATYSLMWSLHAPGPWQVETRLEILGFFYFAPLSLLAWALFPQSRVRLDSYVLVHRAVLMHIAAIWIVAFLGTALGGLLEWMVFAFFGTAIDLIFIASGPWQPKDVAVASFYKRGLLIVNGGFVAALMAWSFGNIVIIAWSSEKIAGDQPYCLHSSLPGAGNYKAVGSLLELRGLTLQAPSDSDGLQYNFHAVLAVQGERGIDWYNWSYRAMRFMPLVPTEFEGARTGMRQPQCKLQPHFVRVLSPL